MSHVTVSPCHAGKASQRRRRPALALALGAGAAIVGAGVASQAYAALQNSPAIQRSDTGVKTARQEFGWMASDEDSDVFSQTRLGNKGPRTTSWQADVEPLHDLITSQANVTAYALRPGSIPLEPPEHEAVRYDIPGFSPGFVIDNVLSHEACQKLIRLCEDIGFRKRWGKLGVITLFLDEAFERSIFSRVEHLIPSQIGGRPKSIQHRWAVVKYEPGQYMDPHIDGHVPDAVRVGDAIRHAPGTRSYMTALFWLSDDVVGGETVFTFPQGGVWVKIPPKKGAALFFNHGQNAVSNPLHHGGSVESGIKYLVRADVIY